MATTSAWDNLKKQGKNILNMVNTALPNNPINKLERTYNALKRDTAPTIQKATQVINEFNWNWGEQNDGSKLIWFNNPAKILQTWWQLAPKTPQVDTTAYLNIQNKVDNLPKSSNAKQNFDSKVKIANLRNADQEQILNAFQKAMYDTNGGLTYEYVNQVIQENKINDTYPKFNAQDIISLQYDITPTLRQTGEYVDNKQIAQAYPNLYDFADVKEIQRKYKEQDEKLQKMMESVNKANYNVLSDNGKIWYNLIQSYAGIPDQVRQQFNVSPNVSDSEIISTLAEQDEGTQNLLNRIKKAEDKLTIQDKKQLFNNTGAWAIIKYAVDLFSWVFLNPTIFNTQNSQTLWQLNDWWQNTVQPKINAGWVRDENWNLLPWQQAVSSILSMPWNIISWANRVVTNWLQLTDIDPNKSVWKQISEKLENLVKVSWGTIETAFNTVLAPITATFHAVSDIPVMWDIMNWWFELIPSVVDTVLSWKWRQQVSDATWGQWWLEWESPISDWYNNELDDQWREDLQNSIFLWLIHKYNWSKTKLKVDAFGKTLWEATKDSITAWKFWYDLEKFYQEWDKTWKGKEKIHTLLNPDGEVTYSTPEQEVFRRRKTSKIEDIKDDLKAVWKWVKIGTEYLLDQITNPRSKSNLRLETRNNIITWEAEKTKVTNEVKKETSDLEKEVKEQNANIDKKLNELNKRISDEIKLSKWEWRDETKRNIVEISKEKLTWLDEWTLWRIKENPVAREMTGRLISDLEEDPTLDINEYQTKYLEDTAKEVSDKIDQHLDKLYNQIGSLYEAVESTNKPVDNAGLLRDVLNAIKDRVRFNEDWEAVFSNRINGSERNTILQLINDIRNIDDIKKLIEAKRYADDNIPYWDSLTPWERVIWEIRDKINDLAREQSPEYKKVDDMYSEEIKILNDFKDGISTRKNGKIVLRDNFVSTLKNLLSPANRGKLARIEKQIPRIRDFVEAVQLLKPAYNALKTGYQSRFVWGIAKWTWGMLLRMAWLTMWWLSWYLAWTLADIWISEAMQSLAKKALKSVLEKESPTARRRTEQIVKKIMEGKELDRKEREYIKKLEQEIYEEADKAKKTKAEKEAWDKFNKEVEEDANTPKLEKKDNVKNEWKTIVTWNDKTIVSDGKWNNKRQGSVSEADKRTEENKKTWYMTEDQLKAYNKNKTIQRYTDKAKPNHEKLKAWLDVLEKAWEKLNEKQLEQLWKDVTDLSKDIAEIVARWGEVPKDMMDSLERAQKILDNNWVFSDVKRIEDWDIMDTDDFPSWKYHTTSKFWVYEESEWIKEYKKAHNGEIPEDALFEVVKVITHPKVKKNEYWGVNSYWPWIAVVRLILPEEVGKLGNKKPVSQKSDEPVKPQSKNTVTGTKTAVVDKTETPQKTAENIVKEAKAVEENKQLPATKTAVTWTKKTKWWTSIVDNFKKETKKYIPNAEEIEDEVWAWIDATLEEADIDWFVKGIAIIWSRSRWMDQDESDLDIVAEIEWNDLREDWLFNILNNEDYSLVYYKTDDGKYTLTRPKDYEWEWIKVDINPIIKDKTGTIEDYLIKETDYLWKKSTAYFEARGYYPWTEWWSIERDRKKNWVKWPVWDWLKANWFADIDIEWIDLDSIDIKKLSRILNRGKDFDMQYDKSWDLRIIDKDWKEREYLKWWENKLLWNIKNDIRTNKRYPNTDYWKQAVTWTKTEITNSKDTATQINNIKSFDDLSNMFEFEKPWEKADWYYVWTLNWVKTKVWEHWSTIFVKYWDDKNTPAQASISKNDSDYIDQLKELLSEINNDGEILEANRNNYNPAQKNKVTASKNKVTAKSEIIESAQPVMKPIENLDDFKREIIDKRDTGWKVAMFNRMLSDINYIVNNNLWKAWYRHLRAVWNPEKHIQYMKALLDSIPEEDRPDVDMEWLENSLMNVSDAPITNTKTAVTAPKKQNGKTAKEWLEAIVKKRKDVEMYNFDDEDSEWGGRNSQRYLNFAKELNKAYKKVADEVWMELTSFNKWYYNPTAYFRDPDTDKYYYVSISDTRDPKWWESILYRDAKSATDSIGWSNQYVDLVDLPRALSVKKEIASKSSETPTNSTTEKWNYFWLKHQKWSSRINNFTNVIKDITDKYEWDIEKYIDTLTIKKEPYLPLQISKAGNELVVRHINHGYNDPAIKFIITDEWKLHATWIKLAYMEQMWIRDWSKDIKDTDEILHTRAVNLEDQFLDRSTIDEDTGEMKTSITGKKNAVTAKPATDEEITGRFRNLTAEDYKEMKQFEGKEELYYNSWEDPDALAYAFILEDVVKRLENDDIHYDEYDNYDFNLNDPSAIVDRRMFIKEYEFLQRARSWKATKQEMDDHDYAIDNWEEYDEKHPEKFKPDWNIEMIIEAVQEFMQWVFWKEPVYDPFLTQAYNTFERLVDDKDKYLKDIDKKRETIKKLVDKYWKWREANWQTIDNTPKNNITASNRTALTSNNNNNGGSKETNWQEHERHAELSNTSKTILTNDKWTKVTADSWNTITSTDSMNTNMNNISESWDRSWTWRSNNELIWEKWNDVITDKTVTEARDINRECVSILEKHDYSTNPKDYTEKEIDTLRQYEGRGGVNDKQDSNIQGALNQYYTKDNVIKAIWRLIDPYLPKTRKFDLLEPSLWTWRFFMYAPENANLFWFELDKVPWTIAKILYPNADIKIMDFQDNFMVGKYSVWENYKGKKYYVIIGNPPYEERQWRQRWLWEEPKINRFDDYFIKRGIDMLEDGWILVFVTSSQFLRGADNYAKQQIAKNAQLIDAYRLPIWTFDRTWVETDIVMFQKNAEWWNPALLSSSQWFINNPLKVLWEETDVEWRFWTRKWVVWDINAIDSIADTKFINTTDGNPATLESTFTPTEEVKKEEPVTTKTIEAKKENKQRKKIDQGEWKDWTETRLNDAGEQETLTWWKSLNWIIFKGKWGKTWTMTVWKWGIWKYQKVLNANGKIWDPDITLESDREWLNYINWELEPNILYASWHIPTKLAQLEIDYSWWFIDEKQYNKQKDLLEQAMPEERQFQDIYFSPYVDWILDFDTNEITTIRTREWMKDVKSSIRSVFSKYINERISSYRIIDYKDSKWEVQTANAWQIMLDILNSTKLFPKSAKEKVVTLFPNEFNSFMKWYTLDSETKSRLQAEFNRRYNGYSNFNYSDLWLTVEDISETFRNNIFNLSDVQARGIARILTTESMIIAHGVWQGKTIEWIIGAIASMQQGKARKALIVIPAWTKSWWMQTVAQLFPNQEMVDLWSLAKGTWVRKKLVEMFWPDPRDWIQDWQLVFLEHSAIGRQISFKSDTLTELEQNLTDVMESNFEVEKTIANKKKDVEKQQNAIERWREKWLSASELEKKENKMQELLAEIEQLGSKTENPLQDIINAYSDKWANEEIITEAVSKIDEDYDTYIHDMNEFVNKQINEWWAKLDKDKAIKVVEDIFSNERAIYMEDLWIDHMTVDEAHNFRNLFNKALQDDDDWGSYHAWINTKEWSKQAKNLYAMSQYIMSKNWGWNVILLTATPFINDPSEMYNMLSYVGKNGLVEMWVNNIDAFYDNFVWLENRVSPTASTSWVEHKNVMVWFNNTDTLVKNLLDRYIDYEWESLNIVKPRLVTNVVRLTMSPLEKEIEDLLETQIDENSYQDSWRWVPLWKNRKVNDRWEEMWAVLEWLNQANLNLISPYLTKYLKDKLPWLTWQEMLDSSPKLDMVVKIIKLQRELWIFRGTFVFMEQWKELHELLKKAIEESIPWIKVWIINGDKKYSDLTDAQAKKLWISAKGAKARLTAKQFHDGEIDVLIWGANTKEWIELQGNGYHLLEVSQPRNMNDRTQLIGRMWRQWNLSNEVIDTLLLMNDSSDIYRFELMARKESRWNILEMLSAYKKWERIEDVKVDGQLDMNEEKLALFTDPKKKAKVSIVMEESALKEEQAQINWQRASVEKLINTIANWWNDYWRYRKIWQWVWNMSKLYDADNKAVTTNILDENALEPLEQQLNYTREEAMKEVAKVKERRGENWNKAEMERRVRNNDPYSYEWYMWNEVNDKLKQARSERNVAIRQTEALWMRSIEELQDFLVKLEDKNKELEEKIKSINDTYNEKVKFFEEEQEKNKEYELDTDTILQDLTEDFKHQVTLQNKESLRNWIELTKDLPKRKQARTKTAITEWKNKYEWKSEDYVWKQATFTKPKNLITSKFQWYTDSYQKPEIKFVWYVRKEVIKTEDWKQLTKIWFQDQFLSMRDSLRKIKNKYIQQEESKAYWKRWDVDEMLSRDEYFQWLKKRLTNMILKFAKRFDDEIINAFKKDNPWITNPTAEDFYNYLNDYTIEKTKDWDRVMRVWDEYVKEGAEYLAEKFKSGWSKSSITANGKNKLTS